MGRQNYNETTDCLQFSTAKNHLYAISATSSYEWKFFSPSNEETTTPSNNQSTEEALLGHTQFIHERNKPPCSPQLCTILKLLTFDTVVAKHIYVRVTRSAQYGFLPRSTGNGQVNRFRTKTIRHLSTCWRAVHAREWTSRGCFCLQTQLHRLPCCGLFACTCCRVV